MTFFKATSPDSHVASEAFGRASVGAPRGGSQDC
jgi:hypothetical protein